MKILWFERIRKKYFIKQRQLIEMVNAETNLLLKLRHPHVVQFKEAIYSPEKERMFIVLEYCSKGSLLAILNNRLTAEDWEWHA
jgi:serine/threonine protein kinase